MTNKIIDFKLAKNNALEKIIECRVQECLDLCDGLACLASDMEMTMLLLGIDELQVKDGKVSRTKIDKKWHSELSYKIWPTPDEPEMDE